METIQNKDTWYKLDTAAKLYPAILSPKQASVFRLSCILKEPVDPEILQAALTVTIRRYPTFNVRLKRGIFWFYFETNEKLPMIRTESVHPCQLIDPKENNDFLFQVSWFESRINLEIFHGITDGSGGLEFLKTLIYYYLLLQGKTVQTSGMIRTLEQTADPEETENSFHRYYDPHLQSSRGEEKAYHLSGKTLLEHQLRLIHGLIPAEELVNKARSYQATVTEYLTAVLLSAFFVVDNGQSDPDKIVKISVPINLRNLFPSQTLRNFSFFVNVGERFRNRQTGFDILLSTVKTQMKSQIRKDLIAARMNPNVSMEKNTALQVVPLDIKQALIKQVHRIVGDDLFTCSLSNLGVIKMPESMAPFISRFDFSLSISERVPLNCSICSSNGIVSCTFSSSLREASVEQAFFRILAADRLPITIESNQNSGKQ